MIDMLSLYIFSSSTFSPNTFSHIKVYFIEVCFRELSHSCASLWLSIGVPMKQLHQWFGHRDLSTTANVYAHLDVTVKSAHEWTTALRFARILQNRGIVTGSLRELLRMSEKGNTQWKRDCKYQTTGRRRYNGKIKSTPTTAAGAPCASGVAKTLSAPEITISGRDGSAK